jgi:UDPglucose--hexose-1-phosphate uridylyltransferase
MAKPGKRGAQGLPQMTTGPSKGKWEQRWHPLRREWVVYSAHRDSRPWHGKRETVAVPAPDYDPHCYLCPGNKRVHGHANLAYEDVFIFDNDHPVVGREAPEPGSPPIEPYRVGRADGLARVVCYDPRHNVTLTEMSLPKAAKVFHAWREQMRELARTPGIRFALIFENKGSLVGTSSPHPHCQIYATNFTFKNVETEMEAAAEFGRAGGGNLFEQILKAEKADGRRIVSENGEAIAFLPFFARWPYEVWIFPKRRHATLATLTDKELVGLCAVFQETTRRYDLLHGMSFPYVMSFYQAPFGEDHPDYHLHMVLLPPLRQPGLQKFPAGPEIGGGNFMSDSLPEDKAAELRAVDLASFKEIP